jgi:hypothetical protein
LEEEKGAAELPGKAPGQEPGGQSSPTPTEQPGRFRVIEMELNCDSMRYLLEAFRRGDLTEDQKAAVLHHMLHCPECMFLLTLSPVLVEN